MVKQEFCRVCSCTPAEGIVQIDARCLVNMVNHEILRIRCMENLRRKAHRAMNLGDICARCDHPLWAMKVYNFARGLIETRDWDDWRHTSWADPWYQLESMVSEDEARELGCRADNVWSQIGHPEMRHFELLAKRSYDFLWLDKWDIDRDEPGPEDEEPDSSIAVFNDALPYWRPLFTQSIYEQ